jgi:hypothetical protein
LHPEPQKQDRAEHRGNGIDDHRNDVIEHGAPPKKMPAARHKVM